MQAVIQVEGLGKRYRVGQRESYGSLRDSLTRLFQPPSRKRVDAQMMWALKDVSFEMNHGEVLGIVGTNGSGKSTLLKILARITEPTEGWAEIRGRVGSLLEVGTGFHPELTGRENVFVNGAILGMKRREIERKFDEIVAFADVDRFIDTPVKHYSSGMQMRLAFAVAAHLEPNILLVDEVLAVGDLAFQKKCLGKMDQVSRAGRTVLFVSHQMNQVRRVCNRCLWLDRGRVVDIGPTQTITTRYEASFMESIRRPHAAGVMRGTRFLGWTLGESGSGRHVLDTFGPTTVRFLFHTDREIRDAHHGIALHDANGQVVWGTGTDNILLVPGVNELVYSLATLPLRPGPYRWLTTIYENGQFVDGGDCIPELAIQTPPLGHRQDRFAGIVNLPYSFEVRSRQDFQPSTEAVEAAAR